MLDSSQRRRPARARRQTNRPLIVARLRQGLSANALALRAGLSGNTVLAAERGEYVHPYSQRAIAEALGEDDVLALFPFERQKEAA